MFRLFLILFIYSKVYKVAYLDNFMRLEKDLEIILERVLENLAKKSVKAKNHKERKNHNETAYALIRERYGDDLVNIKRFDRYYKDVKRELR